MATATGYKCTHRKIYGRGQRLHRLNADRSRRAREPCVSPATVREKSQGSSARRVGRCRCTWAPFAIWLFPAFAGFGGWGLAMACDLALLGLRFFVNTHVKMLHRSEH